MNAVFRSGIDSPFSPTTFDDLSIKGSFENPIVLDEKEDKENALSSAFVSVRPTEPPRLQKNRAFGARIENFSEYVFRNLYQ